MGADDSAVNRTNGRTIWPQVRSLLVTAAVVLVFTSLLLIVSGAPPLDAYYHLFQGSLSSWVKFTHVIKAWIQIGRASCRERV